MAQAVVGVLTHRVAGSQLHSPWLKGFRNARATGSLRPVPVVEASASKGSQADCASQCAMGNGFSHTSLEKEALNFTHGYSTITSATAPGSQPIAAASASRRSVPVVFAEIVNVPAALPDARSVKLPKHMEFLQQVRER